MRNQPQKSRPHRSQPPRSPVSNSETFSFTMPRCQEEEFPPDVAAADRGPERKLVCYPTGHLGLRLIDHAPFRGTEFCAQTNSLSFYIVSFFINGRFFLIDFWNLSVRGLFFISYAFISGD